MRTDVARFDYHRATDRRGSYCVFRNVEYNKSKFLGSGTYGEVYRFTSDQPEALNIVVKIEIPEEVDDSKELVFCKADEFINEAYFSNHILGLGAFSGDLEDDEEPHYVLEPFLEGMILSVLHSISVIDFLQICKSLLNQFTVYAEVYKAVHGDVRRANIMVSKDSSGGYKAVLFDFNLTRLIGEKTHGHASGYHSPELHSSVDAKPSQDIYSFGSELKDYCRDNAVTGLNKNVIDFLYACREADPKKRMSLTRAHKEIDDLQQQAIESETKQIPAPISSSPTHSPPSVATQQLFRTPSPERWTLQNSKEWEDFSTKLIKGDSKQIEQCINSSKLLSYKIIRPHGLRIIEKVLGNTQLSEAESKEITLILLEKLALKQNILLRKAIFFQIYSRPIWSKILADVYCQAIQAEPSRIDDAFYKIDKLIWNIVLNNNPDPRPVFMAFLAGISDDPTLSGYKEIKNDHCKSQLFDFFKFWLDKIKYSHEVTCGYNSVKDLFSGFKYKDILEEMIQTRLLRLTSQGEQKEGAPSIADSKNDSKVHPANGKITDKNINKSSTHSRGRFFCCFAKQNSSPKIQKSKDITNELLRRETDTQEKINEAIGNGWREFK